MAKIYELTKRRLAKNAAGQVGLTWPEGVAAIAWTIEVGDPETPNPQPADVTALIQWSPDGVSWQTVSTFVAKGATRSTGVINAREGGSWRLLYVVNQGDDVYLLVEG